MPFDPGGSMIAHLLRYLNPLSSQQLKQRTPSDKTFWIRACNMKQLETMRNQCFSDYCIGILIYGTQGLEL